MDRLTSRERNAVESLPVTLAPFCGACFEPEDEGFGVEDDPSRVGWNCALREQGSSGGAGRIYRKNPVAVLSSPVVFLAHVHVLVVRVAALNSRYRIGFLLSHSSVIATAVVDAFVYCRAPKASCLS